MIPQADGFEVSRAKATIVERAHFAQEVLDAVSAFLVELADSRDDKLRQHPAIVALFERVEKIELH